MYINRYIFAIVRQGFNLKRGKNRKLCSKMSGSRLGHSSVAAGGVTGANISARQCRRVIYLQLVVPPRPAAAPRGRLTCSQAYVQIFGQHD